jgi:hypothetical protein
MGEECILLSFIETMDFINKKKRAKLKVPVLTGVFNDFLDIFFATRYG